MSHFSFESFVILPDLSRVASGEEQRGARSFRRDPWVLTAEILHNVYGVPIKYGTGFTVEKFENVLPNDFQDRYYACLGLEGRCVEDATDKTGSWSYNQPIEITRRAQPGISDD